MTLYARHEQQVLRFFMERVRSPELACDLTAETFATALEQRFDPSRQGEAEWVLALANAQLLRAYRVGAVDDAARSRLGLAPIALDDRTLDRVWQLRGEDRNEERKPRLSGRVLVGEAARGVAASTVAARAASSVPDTTDAALVLPAVAGALDDAAGRAQGRRRNRRRWMIGARVAIAVVTVTWVVGEAVTPERPAATPGTWLPYEVEHARGAFPRTWFMTPPGATFTTFATGAGTRCSMGSSDALVAITDSRPVRPAAACVRRARVSRRALRDGLWALIVLGPRASGATRREADAIAARAGRPDR
jgi:DNA-directed RNA polymerase specialized sigma24 family protein